MGNLLPNEAMIYERSDDVVYARYRDKPDIPRWIVGGSSEGVARAQGKMLTTAEWNELLELSKTNKTLKKLLDKLVNTYYIIKTQEIK